MLPEIKEGANCEPLQIRHEWDPKTPASPQPIGVGKTGGSRAKPLSVINKRASKEVSYESLHFL